MFSTPCPQCGCLLIQDLTGARCINLLCASQPALSHRPAGPSAAWKPQPSSDTRAAAARNCPYCGEFRSEVRGTLSCTMHGCPGNTLAASSANPTLRTQTNPAGLAALTMLLAPLPEFAQSDISYSPQGSRSGSPVDLRRARACTPSWASHEFDMPSGMSSSLAAAASDFGFSNAECPFCRANGSNVTVIDSNRIACHLHPSCQFYRDKKTSVRRPAPLVFQNTRPCVHCGSKNTQISGGDILLCMDCWGDEVL